MIRLLIIARGIHLQTDIWQSCNVHNRKIAAFIYKPIRLFTGLSEQFKLNLTNREMQCLKNLFRCGSAL